MKPALGHEKKSKIPWHLVAVFGLFLLLRLGDIFRTLSKDEAGWVMAAFNYHAFTDWLIHPPFGIGLISQWYHFFGIMGMRFLPLLFAVMVFFLLWHFLQKNTDEKTTFWVLLLYSVLHYAVMAGQILDVDGSILASVYLVAVIFFFEGVKDARWLMVSGIVLGISLWIRFTAPLLVVPLLIILGLQERKMDQKKWALLVVPIFASLVLFLAFDQLATGGQYLPRIVQHNFSNSSVSYESGLGDVFVSKVQAIYLYQRRLIPSFLVLLGLGLLLAWKEKNKFIQSTGIISVFFLAFWLLPSGGDKLRLLSSVLPLLSVGAGFALREISEWKQGLVVAGLAAVYGVIFFIGGLTEYETLETVLDLTIAKGVLLLGIPLVVWGFTRDRRVALMVLVAGLLGASLFYTGISSMEKDTSLLAGYIASVSQPAMVNGDYGACVYKALENIPCVVQSEIPTGYQYVNYVREGNRIRLETFEGDVDSTRDVMRAYGLIHYFFTQKVFRSTGVPDLSDCEETALELYGRNLGSHFTCLPIVEQS